MRAQVRTISIALSLLGSVGTSFSAQPIHHGKRYSFNQAKSIARGVIASRNPSNVREATRAIMHVFLHEHPTAEEHAELQSLIAQVREMEFDHSPGVTTAHNGKPLDKQALAKRAEFAALERKPGSVPKSPPSATTEPLSAPSDRI